METISHLGVAVEKLIMGFARSFYHRPFPTL